MDKWEESKKQLAASIREGLSEQEKNAGVEQVREQALAYLEQSEEEKSAITFDRQGTYTIEDYYALPEDQRFELIDGVFYDMAAPRTLHQRIAGEIFFQISNYIKDKGGSCIPYMGPVDVQLDCDNRTMVQPDVIILCDEEKDDTYRLQGAPDFVLEVISPSTRKKDYTLKLHKYINAGVREYWIVDPCLGKVVVYLLEEEGLPRISGFEEPVPVHIYGGKLKIDLRDIAKSMPTDGSR